MITDGWSSELGGVTDGWMGGTTININLNININVNDNIKVSIKVYTRFQNQNR